MRDVSERNISYRDSETMTSTQKPIYCRSKHFIDLLNNYQGLLSYQIEDDVIEKLKEYFTSNGLELKTLTRSNITRALLEIGYPKYYDSVNYLFSFFTSNRLPRLKKEQEEILVSGFEMLQRAFNEFTVEECGERTNLMKGSIILKTLLVKNGIKYNKECFPDLKCQARNREYDKLLNVLFEKLGWKKQPKLKSK
jgi:hypothetical protein